MVHGDRDISGGWGWLTRYSINCIKVNWVEKFGGGGGSNIGGGVDIWRGQSKFDTFMAIHTVQGLL